MPSHVHKKSRRLAASALTAVMLAFGLVALNPAPSANAAPASGHVLAGKTTGTVPMFLVNRCNTTKRVEVKHNKTFTTYVSADSTRKIWVPANMTVRVKTKDFGTRYLKTKSGTHEWVYVC